MSRKIIRPINPRTGKEYGRSWAYWKRHPDKAEENREKLEVHHWRYDKPELVNTLCRTCHKIQHVKDFPRWNRCKIESDKQLNKLQELMN